MGLWIAPCVGLAVTVMGVHCRAMDCTLCWTCCHCNGGALWGCGLHPVLDLLSL